MPVNESPYMIERGSGLAHIRLKASPRDCVACIRLDALDLVTEIVRRETLAEVSALMAARAIGGSMGSLM